MANMINHRAGPSARLVAALVVNVTLHGKGDLRYQQFADALFVVGKAKYVRYPRYASYIDHSAITFIARQTYLSSSNTDKLNNHPDRVY